mmetsp:Transcript_48397/g.155784  ORF Transcript_48397/g.155784 Transcript_48397/m.155784 type:complete len:218 (+) Transcript_48397:462-1115(+)
MTIPAPQSKVLQSGSSSPACRGRNVDHMNSIDGSGLIVVQCCATRWSNVCSTTVPPFATAASECRPKPRTAASRANWSARPKTVRPVAARKSFRSWRSVSLSSGMVFTRHLRASARYCSYHISGWQRCCAMYGERKPGAPRRYVSTVAASGFVTCSIVAQSWASSASSKSNVQHSACAAPPSVRGVKGDWHLAASSGRERMSVVKCRSHTEWRQTKV